MQAYGFDKKALRLIKHYLENHIQRKKLDKNAVLGGNKFDILQSSILDSKLYVNLCDLFLINIDSNQHSKLCIATI